METFSEIIKCDLKRYSNSYGQSKAAIYPKNAYAKLINHEKELLQVSFFKSSNHLSSSLRVFESHHFSLGFILNFATGRTNKVFFTSALIHLKKTFVLFNRFANILE